MAVKLTKKPAKAETSKQIVDNGKKETVAESLAEETVPVPEEVAVPTHTQEQPWCEVGVSANYTHNLGNYQSARIGVSLKIPCLHAEIDAVYEFAEEWVNARMEKAQAELAGQ